MTTQAEYLSQVTRATALRALQELEDLQAERDALRAFARGVLKDFFEFGAPDDFKIQELAVEHGLLEGVEVNEPCREDGCWCAEWDDFPQTCYRRTELLTGKEG